MIRAVLHTEVSRDDIDDAALRCGWQLTNIITGSAQQPAQMMYAAREGRTPLYLVEDARLDALYFASQGEGADEVMAQVQEQLHCCAADAHHQWLNNFDDVKRVRRGLGIMVLQVSPPDDAALKLMEQALTHPNEQVRTLALTAVSYAPWSALRPTIETLIKNDPNTAVRAAATQLLTALFPTPTSAR